MTSKTIKWGLGLLIAGWIGAPLASAASTFTAAMWQDEPEEEVEEASEDDEEDKETYLALVGGDIYTGTGGVLRAATLLTKNKKILAMGYDVEVPEEAEVVDVAGMRIYPGLIAVGSFGLFGGGGDLKDSVDPFSQSMTLALSAGITTAVNGNSVAKLKRGHVKDLVIKSSALSLIHI